MSTSSTFPSGTGSSDGDDTTSLSSSAYMISSQFNTSFHQQSSSEGEISSLPSETSTESDLISDFDDDSDAEEQWRESLQQLELLLTMVLVPFIGKYAGRRCAYWGWTKFMEWQYPIETVLKNRAVASRSTGAASL